MPVIIDLESEFFKAAKDLESYSKARKQFIKRIRQISKEWIDDKLRLGILGLK